MMRHHQSSMEALEGTSRLPISHLIGLNLAVHSRLRLDCLFSSLRRMALVRRSECLMCGVGIEVLDIATADGKDNG